MEERLQKAFESATTVTQQLITLSVAMIGGFITFAKPDSGSTLDFKSWGPGITFAMLCLAISTVCGLITLMLITGELGNSKIPKPSPYRGSIRLFCGLQALFFAAGAVFFVFAGPSWAWSWPFGS